VDRKTSASLSRESAVRGRLRLPSGPGAFPARSARPVFALPDGSMLSVPPPFFTVGAMFHARGDDFLRWSSSRAVADLTAAEYPEPLARFTRTLQTSPEGSTFSREQQGGDR